MNKKFRGEKFVLKMVSVKGKIEKLGKILEEDIEWNCLDTDLRIGNWLGTAADGLGIGNRDEDLRQTETIKMSNAGDHEKSNRKKITDCLNESLKERFGTGENGIGSVKINTVSQTDARHEKSSKLSANTFLGHLKFPQIESFKDIQGREKP